MRGAHRDSRLYEVPINGTTIGLTLYPYHRPGQCGALAVAMPTGTGGELLVVRSHFSLPNLEPPSAIQLPGLAPINLPVENWKGSYRASSSPRPRLKRCNLPHDSSQCPTILVPIIVSFSNLSDFLPARPSTRHIKSHTRI